MADERKTTKYIVLYRADAVLVPEGASATPYPATGWIVLDGEYDSVNAIGAVKTAAAKKGDAGQYAAVPASSWKPTRVVLETSTRVVVS